MSNAALDVTYKEVESIPEFVDATRLRVDVFIKEQGFPPGWEPDEGDKIARHYLAILDGKIIATARVNETAKREFGIQRMAVEKDQRGQEVGRGLVTFIIAETKKLNPARIWARSQVQAQKFYEKCGFSTVSQPFEMYGSSHIDLDFKL